MIFLCKMGLESGMVEVGRYSSNLLCQDGEPTRMCIEAAKKTTRICIEPQTNGDLTKTSFGDGSKLLHFHILEE
jgi:hypothetical protein